MERLDTSFSTLAGKGSNTPTPGQRKQSNTRGFFLVKWLKFRVGRHITKCKAVLGIIGPGSSVWVGSMDWAQGGLYFNNRRPIFPLRQEQARLVGSLPHGTQTKLVYFIFTSFQKTHSLWPFLWWKRTSGQNPNQIRKLVWTLRSTPGLPCHINAIIIQS